MKPGEDVTETQDAAQFNAYIEVVMQVSRLTAQRDMLAGFLVICIGLLALGMISAGVSWR